MNTSGDKRAFSFNIFHSTAQQYLASSPHLVWRAVLIFGALAALSLGGGVSQTSGGPAPTPSPAATAWYDLYVRRMDFTTDTPALGEPVQMFVMIATDTYPSQGPYFPDSAFRWRKGPAYPWQEEACPANTRYANCVKTLQFSYDQSGSYEVQVEADSGQQVVEADEGNNTKSWTVNVGQADTELLPTSTPVVDNLPTVSPVSEYDLYVRRMDFSTDRPMVGETVRLFIMLATDSYPAQGPYFPASTFRWRRGDGSAWHDENCPANERYASCVATVELRYALPGTYVVGVEVDSSNSVVEKDETNNVRRWTVTVAQAPIPAPSQTPIPAAAPPPTPTR
jgi:hypothetical protein